MYYSLSDNLASLIDEMIYIDNEMQGYINNISDMKKCQTSNAKNGVSNQIPRYVFNCFNIQIGNGKIYSMNHNAIKFL
jgi:hypothetical protein